MSITQDPTSCSYIEQITLPFDLVVLANPNNNTDSAEIKDEDEQQAKLRADEMDNYTKGLKMYTNINLDFQGARSDTLLYTNKTIRDTLLEI